MSILRSQQFYRILIPPVGNLYYNEYQLFKQATQSHDSTKVKVFYDTPAVATHNVLLNRSIAFTSRVVMFHMTQAMIQFNRVLGIVSNYTNKQTRLKYSTKIILQNEEVDRVNRIQADGNS